MSLNSMSEKAASSKRTVRNDVILIGGLLLIAAIGMFYLFTMRPKGDTVKITIDGKLYKTYSLEENITDDIYSGENKEKHNRLIIREGKAHIETATCPDGICVCHAPIFRDGESIVCLPNRVVVTVTRQNISDSPDIVI